MCVTFSGEVESGFEERRHIRPAADSQTRSRIWRQRGHPEVSARTEDRSHVFCR